MGLIELFVADLATTTVSSGGTDAPASGTPETLTVASAAMFGTAVSGVSQFHFADTAPGKGTEIYAATATSGTTWTVTRGAEGTTPVTHVAGFTIVQVGTAGFLGGVIQAAGGAMSGPLGLAGVPVLSGSTYDVLTSNADNTAALTSWMAECSALGADGWLDAGTYTFTGQVNAENLGKLTIRGPGGYLLAGGARLQYTGAAGDTTLSAGASVTSATMTLAVTSTAALLASGSAVVETSLGNQTIAYTGSAGGNLTGVTGFATSTVITGARIWNPVINLRRNQDITWEGVGITYTSSSCTGTLLDLSGNSSVTANNHLISRCFIGSLTRTTATLVNVNNSFAMAFRSVRFYGSNIGAEGYSGTTNAAAGYNFANGVSFTDCYYSSTASYFVHNPGTGWTFTGLVAEPYNGSAFVGNFIHCDTANSESSVTVTGGWFGDAASGNWITFQGWSLNLIGTYFSNTGGNVVQLSGGAGSVCVSGGYYKTPSPYAVVNANSQTAGSVAVTGASYFTGTTPLINSSGVSSVLTDAGTGTFTASNISATSVAVPAAGGTNLMTSAMALPTSAANWALSGCALTFVSAPSLASGGGALRMLPTVAAVASSFAPNGSSFRVAVTAGLTYTALAYGQATTSTAGTWDIIIYWYNSGGSNISTTATTGIVLASGSWTEMAVTGTAPAGAVSAGLLAKWVPPGGSATADVFYFCQLSVAAGSSTVWTAPGASPVVGMTASGLTAGGQRVTSAAPGVAGTDLATVSQIPVNYPAVNGVVNLTAQSAAITATALVTASVASLWRVSYYAKVTTAASSSSTIGTITIGWTDGDDFTAQTAVSASSSANTTTTVLQGSVIVEAAAATAITYAMAYASSGGTPMQYSLHLTAELM